MPQRVPISRKKERKQQKKTGSRRRHVGEWVTGKFPWKSRSLSFCGGGGGCGKVLVGKPNKTHSRVKWRNFTLRHSVVNGIFLSYFFLGHKSVRIFRGMLSESNQRNDLVLRWLIYEQSFGESGPWTRVMWVLLVKEELLWIISNEKLSKKTQGCFGVPLKM